MLIVTDMPCVAIPWQHNKDAWAETQRRKLTAAGIFHPVIDGIDRCSNKQQL
jgi:hypothetical protein